MIGKKQEPFKDKLSLRKIKYQLKTKFIGKKIYYFEVLDSTQDTAHKLAQEGSPEGTLILSEEQKKGRGRLQRRWFSSLGGLYFSLILRPGFIAIKEIPQITLLASLACVYGIKKATNLQCSLKWPNDIFLNHKKAGGILAEVNTKSGKVNFVILGIGINVNTKDLPASATSLFLCAKKKFNRSQILTKILEEIELLYQRLKQEGFSPLLKEWKKYCFLWEKK